VLATVATAVAWMLLETTSSAPPPTAPATAPTGSVTHRETPSDDELARYWTPARLANAVDGGVLDRAGPGGAPAGTGASAFPGPWITPLVPAGAGASGLLTTPVTAAQPVVLAAGAGDGVLPYAGGGLASRVDGALFVTIDGVDYACSGSVVNSLAGDLVLTAAHCLHSGGTGGSFATNVVFVPGYAGGRAPYGIWSGQQLTVTTAWGYQRDFSQDAGFATFRPQRGRTLQQAVGGAFPIAFGQSLGPQTVLAYPRATPFDGQTLMSCTGNPVPDPRGGQSRGVACGMTAGASGGAWLSGLHDGTGAIDAVVSYSYSTDPGTIYGTTLGPAIETLYQHALAL
jgi:hypothetical protein